MSTIDIISDLLKKQNKKQKELTDFLGISKNAFTDWKSGRIKSYQKYLPKIAEFFNVSVDYLLGKVKSEILDKSFLTTDELRLVTLYRSLSPQGKEYIQKTIDMAANTYKKDILSTDIKGIIN